MCFFHTHLTRDTFPAFYPLSLFDVSTVYQFTHTPRRGLWVWPVSAAGPGFHSPFRFTLHGRRSGGAGSSSKNTRMPVLRCA